ncbi:MAG TPA: glutamate synthase [Patescibacteria group bacterium]|nr:glutamate synthase [Patescibacteria group bacterium]
MGQLTSAPAIDCRAMTTREFNERVHELIAEGVKEITVENPDARHALVPGIKADGGTVNFKGPVGWYAAGMNDGLTVKVQGNCGWGVAECMMRGHVEIHGHAGSGASASIRGGLVFIAGDTGARAGIAMKGGTLVVGGSVGVMSGFMMQAGRIIICGGAADGLGDSMYAGTIYIAGAASNLGADAVEKPIDKEDGQMLAETLLPFGIDAGKLPFRRVESGHRLWNFSTKEPELWRHAL